MRKYQSFHWHLILKVLGDPLVGSQHKQCKTHFMQDIFFSLLDGETLVVKLTAVGVIMIMIALHL
jgi:hypothetical protein